jgi:uncharacterized protein (DUF58 family)
MNGQQQGTFRMGQPKPPGPGLIRRWLFPPPPSGSWTRWVPPEGRCWLLAAALLLLVSLVKNINPLLLLSYLLLVTAAFNAWAAGRRLGQLRLRRSVEGPVFAGSPCVVEVRLENPGPRPVTGVAVADAGPDHALTWFVGRIHPGKTRTLRDRVVLPRRGRYPWGEAAAVSGYPFGLVRHRLPLTPPEEVIVLPRLGWVHRGRLRHYLRSVSPEGDAVRRRRPQRHPSAQAEFHGLRAWRPGDSPRFIHWRTSARLGELMVREYEDVPSDNLLLVLDPTAAPGKEALFEEAVSLAATICWDWCRQTSDRLIVTVADAAGDVLDGMAGPAHSRQVLERLALAEAAPAASAAALQTRLAPYVDVAAAAVVVAAGASGLAGPLGAALRRPVACLDAGSADVRDFYDPPAPALPGEGACI